ncbi:hypothetical protein Tco_0302884, partial [Tanacetum coccineum]
SINEIEKVRESFKPGTALDFICKLALEPTIGNEHTGIDFIKDKAKVCRKKKVMAMEKPSRRRQQIAGNAGVEARDPLESLTSFTHFCEFRESQLLPGCPMASSIEYMTRIADLKRNSSSLDERYSNLSKTLEAAKHESLKWKRKYEVALSKQKAGEEQASLEVANLKARSSATEAVTTRNFQNFKLLFYPLTL